jgi:hypothetical protein
MVQPLHVGPYGQGSLGDWNEEFILSQLSLHWLRDHLIESKEIRLQNCTEAGSNPCSIRQFWTWPLTFQPQSLHLSQGLLHLAQEPWEWSDQMKDASTQHIPFRDTYSVMEIPSVGGRASLGGI